MTDSPIIRERETQREREREREAIDDYDIHDKGYQNV
jgi:hypothetical protein